MTGSKNFIPLTASASSGKGPQSELSANRSFVPFTAMSSAASTPAAPRQVASATTPCAGKPEVEAITKDGIVTRIRVTCGCGEVIEVDCLYPATI